MSLSSSVFRSPSHVLSSSSKLLARTSPVSYFASQAPAILSQSANTTSKSLTTLPVALPTTIPIDPTPIWFNSSPPCYSAPSGVNPPNPENERKVKLGKTLRILQKRLPTLLQSPLPQDILSPNISLHLFPSTHYNLPAVSGRVAYTAALRTSPIAWNRVPIIGNHKLQILSERMTNQPLHFSPHRSGAYPEQLVVKWRTAGESNKINDSISLTQQGEYKLDDALRGTQSPGAKREFTGLFIFEFDGDGRVISHTIEHVDEGGEWENGVGAKVVHLTDWLLGNIKGREPQGACIYEEISDEIRKGQR